MRSNSRLIKEANQSKSLLLLSILLGFMAGLLSIFQAWEVSRLINQVFLEGAGFDGISGILLIIFLIMLLRAGIAWCGDLSSSAAARRIKQALRQRLHSHLINLGPSYLRGETGEAEVRSGELVNVSTEGIDALEVFYSQYLPQIALAALIPLSILVIVFPVDFLSGMILLLTAPLLPVFMYLIGSASENLTRKQWQGLSRMSAYFLDVLQGLATLKSLGRSRDQVDVIKKVSEQYRQTTMGVLKVTFLSALVLELIATLSTAVVAVEVGIRLLYGKMAFEQAFFILILAPEFYLPLRLLGTRFHAAMAGVQAGNRIFEILDLPGSNEASLSSNKSYPKNEFISPPYIAFKDIGYAYANNRSALEQVSFEIPSGKMTALVGESGAGKTTLTWLLLRFLKPYSGQILVNGKNLSEIPAQQWMNSLAWVPQNPYLFSDTITANIKLARPEASDAEVIHAARLAHADEFIDHLPQGYSTPIGERGARLSAGQAQRIALARAFLKDANLLILDEATSHLDPETDNLLQDSLTRLSIGRTVLVIAHHQATLARADQVITLSHGKVDKIQQNDHPPLPVETGMQNGLYAATSQTSSAMPRTNFYTELAENKEIKTLPTLRRLIKLLSPYTGRILLSVLLGFATIASGIGLMATSAYIISAAALHPSIAELQVAIVGVRFFGLSRGIFRYLERLVSHDVTFRLLASWRVWFYQALEPLAPARLMQYHSGDLLSRVIADIGTLESFYVRALAPPLVAILVAIFMGVFFTTFGSELAWALIAFLAIAGLGLPVMVSILSRRLGPQLVQARAHLAKVVIDGIQGLPDLLTFSQPDGQIRKMDQAGKCLTHLQARMTGITAAQTAMGGLLANLCMLIVLVLAIQNVSQGQLAGVLLGVVTLGALMSFEAVQPLPLAAQNLEANRAAAGRLYELVDAKAEVIDPEEPLGLQKGNHLVVSQLSFQYPLWAGQTPISVNSDFGLKNISFSLPNGRHIAIVGPSGAGKTTLINLLKRYWKYQIGSIQLNGNEISQYRQQDFRGRIAAVSQGTYLFSVTIKENLLIARPGASMDDLIQATQAAHLHDLIASLPQGYDTWIGEHGLRLSSGERQRLAIARALLKEAPILILDEPTANLDTATEKLVMNSIREYSQRRSTITITQRLAGLDWMDEILVIKDGQIIEQGSHDVLVTKPGLYQQMWMLYNQIM